jgi:DNA-binding transcriptional regulator YhcF (GntR family)
MGYIYTLKAKGSYVSDVATNEDNKRREILNDLQPIVDKAYMTGFNESDIKEMLEQCINEHERNSEHKEEDYDNGN